MYPINLNMTGRACAVVGGGRVAQRKIERLLDYGAKVTVISPELGPELHSLAENGQIIWKRTAYSKDRDLLEGFFCVFCATDDGEINRQAALEAKAKGALVNVATAPELGDFTLPGVVKRGPVQFTVDTDGTSPGFSRLLREDVAQRYHDGFGEFAVFLQEIRQELMAKYGDSQQRGKLWRRLLTADIIELILDNDLDGAKNEIRRGISSFGTEPSDSPR